MAESEVSERTKLTPLMAQYWDIKSAHQDKVVLFRMGDFFEMFHRDAETAAPILGIALTSRNKKAQDETPMCGVPHHSIAGPINKLLAAGYKVAICDQIEDPKFAKGIVKRAVTRVLSPGVVYDPDQISGLSANYLASFDQNHLSFLDSTSGEAFFFRFETRAQRDRLLTSLQPVEVVLAPVAPTTHKEPKTDSTSEVTASHSGRGAQHQSKLGPQNQAKPSAEHSADQELAESLKMLLPNATISEFAGKIVENAGPPSAARLLGYVAAMQGPEFLKTVREFESREIFDRMDLSSAVLQQLEIFANYRGESEGSLFNAIHRCKTSSGARLLKSWLQFPLTSQSAIDKRWNEVDFWLAETAKLSELRAAFAQMGDISRRLAKIANPGCHARDLKALAESLAAGLKVSRIASHREFSQSALQLATSLVNRIERTLVDDPPLSTRQGGLVQKGFDLVLDELITLSTDAGRLVVELEAREKELTGISSLKVRYNNVFGYFIEVTHTHRDRVPSDRYERKQTLANAERFMTKELSELESKVLTAQSKRFELEFEIFNDLRTYVLNQTADLMGLARVWSELDVLSSFAFLAQEQRYVRPRWSTGGRIEIEGSRHPVIEQIAREPFVKNKICLGLGETLLLTGPNMAGKSTLMRQVALTAILAQLGSFVPADAAELPVFDSVFTRIGASDFLSEGLSTFMVEMTETSQILKQMTENSLVILDEIGRGTSTYDGMSLAQAVLENLLERKGGATFFATHYHELTELEARYPNLLNGHMRIHESGGQIRFMYSLTPGSANKSYGIHVAKLAGMPISVTKRAQTLLRDLETRSSDRGGELPLLAWSEGANDNELQDEAFSPAMNSQSEITSKLRALKVEDLTPLQALNLLAEWQREHS